MRRLALGTSLLVAALLMTAPYAQASHCHELSTERENLGAECALCLFHKACGTTDGGEIPVPFQLAPVCDAAPRDESTRATVLLIDADPRAPPVSFV